MKVLVSEKHSETKRMIYDWRMKDNENERLRME